MPLNSPRTPSCFKVCTECYCWFQEVRVIQGVLLICKHGGHNGCQYAPAWWRQERR